MGEYTGVMIETSTLRITPEILILIAELDEFKGSWRTITSLAPDRLLALRRVATIESIGSSTRIEGSKLSNLEVERLLANLKIGRLEHRDEQEVAGYADVAELISASYDSITLTENHIWQLHRDLLKYSSKDQDHCGHYKTLPNTVVAKDENGRHIAVVFETASPFDTPRLMAEIVDWANQMLEGKQLHPLLVIGIFIVVFLEIHPFQDGNGRLSRLLTTLLLLRAGYTHVSYSSLENIIEQSKEGYYLALRQTQGTIRTDAPDWQPWLLFFLKALQQQMKRLETKIEREKIILAPMPALSAQILEHIRSHGRTTIGDLERLTCVSRNTLKGHLRQLNERRFITLHGKGRTAWYSLT
jgi:Fic family protein